MCLIRKMDNNKKMKNIIGRVGGFIFLFSILILMFSQFWLIKTNKIEIFTKTNITTKTSQLEYRITTYPQEDRLVILANQTILKFNYIVLKDMFVSCFSHSSICYLPAKYKNITMPGNNVLCTYMLISIENITLCFDYNSRFSGGFSNSFILYPELFRDHIYPLLLIS